MKKSHKYEESIGCAYLQCIPWYWYIMMAAVIFFLDTYLLNWIDPKDTSFNIFNLLFQGAKLNGPIIKMVLIGSLIIAGVYSFNHKE